MVKFPSLDVVSFIQRDVPFWQISAGFVHNDMLLTGSGLGVLSRWDVRTGELVRSYQGVHRGFIQRIIRSPDGASFVTGSSDRTLKIWDPETMKPKVTLRGHVGELECVAWSPDGRMIASGAFDGTTRLWDAKTQVDPNEILLFSGVRLSSTDYAIA